MASVIQMIEMYQKIIGLLSAFVGEDLSDYSEYSAVSGNALSDLRYSPALPNDIESIADYSGTASYSAENIQQILNGVYPQYFSFAEYPQNQSVSANAYNTALSNTAFPQSFYHNTAQQSNAYSYADYSDTAEYLQTAQYGTYTYPKNSFGFSVYSENFSGYQPSILIADTLDENSEMQTLLLREAAQRITENVRNSGDVRVDMSGMQNIVNNANDINLLVEKLSAAFTEAAYSMSEGVHF